MNAIGAIDNFDCSQDANGFCYVNSPCEDYQSFFAPLKEQGGSDSSINIP